MLGGNCVFVFCVFDRRISLSMCPSGTDLLKPFIYIGFQAFRFDSVLFYSSFVCNINFFIIFALVTSTRNVTL